MAKKKHIGQFLSFKFTDKKGLVEGIVMDHNKDWTLLKYCPGDYVMDGFVIFKNKNIEGYRRTESEKFKEKIVKLKEDMPAEKDKVPIDDIEAILKYLTKKHQIFSLELKSEKAVYLGRLKSFDEKELLIDYLDVDGKWKGKMTFKPNSIRRIYFDNDYINSLKLISSKK